MSLADTLKFVHQQSDGQEQPFRLPALHIAVQGCCHGELDRIYAECRQHTQQTGKKIDLLICCGDFQSTRNDADLSSMAVPPKYRVLGDFPKYANGQATAPVLTLFIGGNHEASAALFEQYHGGFVAPNIYYLGHSGVVNIGGLRIGGLSGVHNAAHVHSPYPVPPYRTMGGDETEIRSAYHVRRFELDKLLMLPSQQQQHQSSSSALPPIDVFISHDWPVGVTDHGNVEELLHIKPYFRDDIHRNTLGNPHTMEVMHHLQPKRWYAAHLHCRFRALVPHRQHQRTTPTSATATAASSHTDFLALNKCVRNPNEFMEYVDISPQPETVQRLGITELAQIQEPLTRCLTVCVDPEWREVVKATHWHVPLALPAGQFQHSEVEWISQAMAGAARFQQQQQQQQSRRDRDDGDDMFKKIVASDTMGLLWNLGMLDEQQSRSDEGGMKATVAVKKPQKLNDGDGEYGWSEEKVDPPPPPPQQQQQQQQKSSTNQIVQGGVLQQNKADDVGFGWSEGS